MNTKLILVEGIPGSGKSTIAAKIARRYEALGRQVNLYQEGQLHPADLGWIACVPAAQFDGVLKKHPLLRGQIKRNTAFEGDYALIAYTQVRHGGKTFHEEMEALEVYDGRAPDEAFYGLHYGRWRAFNGCAAQGDALTIFECAFLQNHVSELLFWRGADEGAVTLHCNRLLECVEPLSPVLIYLSQPDMRETVLRAARERDQWLERVVAYCEVCPYGKLHGIKGFDGAMETFALRKQLELKILDQLDIPHVIIENPDYDWDAVWAQITAYLDGPA